MAFLASCAWAMMNGWPASRSAGRVTSRCAYNPGSEPAFHIDARQRRKQADHPVRRHAVRNPR